MYMNSESIHIHSTANNASILSTNDNDIHVEKNANGLEMFVFDPYNPLNNEITQEGIQTILNTFGVTMPIYNIELYKRAFIHRSYIRLSDKDNELKNIIVISRPDNCLPLHTKSNERLEFIGDGVLECITKYYLYRRFPRGTEGFMTEKKIALVKNESIGRMALEIGLNKWYIMSKHAEQKQTRTNLKKLGCLFEAFIGAIFLDFNKIDVHDDDNWFRDSFHTGPGFQVAQIFIENVFEQYVDWTKLIIDDDNYKNILQVIIQKEFKVTPHYMELEDHNTENGYKTGVFLCIGQPIHMVSIDDCIQYKEFTHFSQIHEYIAKNGKIFMFLGEGIHKLKKKSEQMACEIAIRNIKSF